MNERDEIRRLMDIIERGAAGASVEQNIEDLKLFANAASFLVNKIDGKMKTGEEPRSKPSAPAKPRMPKPKPRRPKRPPTPPPVQARKPAQVTPVASLGAELERLKRVEPQAPRNTAIGSFGSV